MLTEVEEDLEAPETSSEKAKISTRKYNKYTEEDKMRFFFYHIEKLMKPAAAAKVAHINERTAQRWAKQYKEDQAKLLPVKSTTRKRVPPKNLQSKHKEHIKDINDENARLTIEQAMESLTESFEDLKISKTSVYNFMTKECNLSVKRATFHSTKRNSPDNLTARYEWVTKWMATDMDFMKNCIFID